MRASARLVLGIAVVCAFATIGRPAEESFTDTLKKIFAPTPTPAPRKHHKSTSTKKKTASPTPSAKPKAKTSPSATPKRQKKTSPTPTPEESETPSTRKKQKKSPTPSPETSPTPSPEESPTPSTRKKRRSSPTPTVTETPTPSTEKSPSPTPSRKHRKSPTPTATETPTTSPEKSPSPTTTPEPTESASPSATPKKKGAPVSIDPGQIVGYEKYSGEVRRVIDLALDLAGRGLDYKYGSADPDSGGMDCSGFVYYVLTQIGLSDVPRDSAQQYAWVRRAGKFEAVISRKDDTFELANIKPGDLLFWTGTYKIDRDPPITHAMIYLGREKGTNKRIMIGASDGRTYHGESRYGVSVFDFKLSPTAQTQEGRLTPTFVGYGHVPGLTK